MQRGAIERTCLVCKLFFRTHAYMVRQGNGKYCSSKCYGVAKKGFTPTKKQLMSLKLGQGANKGLDGLKNEKHPQWRGDEASYISIHTWLNRNFGKASQCENKLCTKRSKTMEWAKLKGKKYTHCRENFVQLCKSCHTLYDSYHKEIKI